MDLRECEWERWDVCGNVADGVDLWYNYEKTAGIYCLDNIDGKNRYEVMLENFCD